MKKLLISIFTLIFIISVSVVTVNAATSGEVTLKLSKNTLKVGEEFTVTVSVKDSNGYNSLKYGNITITDSNNSTTSNIELKSSEALENNSKSVGVGEQEGSTLYNYTLADNITSNIDVCKLTFKVDSNAVSGTYNIYMGDMKVFNKSDSDDDVTDIGTKYVQVTVSTDGTPAVDPEDDGDNGNNGDAGNAGDNDDGDTTGGRIITPSGAKDTNGGNDSNSGDPDSGSDDEEEDDKELPQTGVEMVSLVAIAGLSVCGVVSYISYKKYKNI